MMIDGAAPQMLARFLGGQLEGVDRLLIAFVSHAQKKVASLQRDFRDARPEVGSVLNVIIVILRIATVVVKKF